VHAGGEQGWKSGHLEPLLFVPPFLIRKTAVDPQHGRQVRDLSGVSTAAQFTHWVTTGLLQTLATEGEDYSGGVSTAVFGFTQL
jgi:hypothetical protein